MRAAVVASAASCGCNTLLGIDDLHFHEADAAPTDASATCDPTAPFAAPTPVAGLSGPIFVVLARLSPDELTAYVSAEIGTSDYNLFVTQRSTVADAFATPVPLTTLNTTASENAPTVSSDQLTIFFSSDRVANEGSHIYAANRSTTVGDFQAPAEVIGVNSSVTTDDDSSQYLSADGEELWFSSTRAGGMGEEDLYVATMTGSQFGTPTVVAELNSAGRDIDPVLSSDKLTIYFSSDRPGGSGGFDVWTSHRMSTSDGFPPPTVVPNVNTSGMDFAAWMSADNCRLYIRSGITGTPNLYVAVRTPR
jgi:Tol biopolymer transport system component